MSERELPVDVFDDIRAAYQAHDPTCLSLPYMWLARRSGVSCLSDLDDCSACGVTFYNEGVAWVNWTAPNDEDEVRLCACCAISRGFAVKETPWGTIIVIDDEAGAEG